MSNFQKIETISKFYKESLLNQKSKVIWMTGLSGSGKSTIALKLEKYFFENNITSKILDGDNLRLALNKDLGFSLDDRRENIRRISEVAKLFLDCGIVTIVSLITPTNELRQIARDIIGDEDFIEVYVKTSLDVCMKRDPKGLYKKQIENFTGISSIFEEPIKSDIIIDTENMTVAEEVKKLFDYYVRQTNN